MSKVRFRNKDERELVIWAKELGWEVTGRNGRSHINLVHKQTGRCTRVQAS